MSLIDSVNYCLWAGDRNICHPRRVYWSRNNLFRWSCEN